MWPLDVPVLNTQIDNLSVKYVQPMETPTSHPIDTHTLYKEQAQLLEIIHQHLQANLNGKWHPQLSMIVIRHGRGQVKPLCDNGTVQKPLCYKPAIQNSDIWSSHNIDGRYNIILLGCSPN